VAAASAIAAAAHVVAGSHARELFCRQSGGLGSVAAHEARRRARRPPPAL